MAEKVKENVIGVQPLAMKYAVKMSGGDLNKAVNYFKLLLETTTHETRAGTLKSNKGETNIMQVDPIMTKEFSKSKYSDKLAALGISDVSKRDPDTSMALGALTYATRLKGDEDLSSAEGRAKVWKDKYNTSAGKGSEEDYLKSIKDFDWSYYDEQINAWLKKGK